MKSLRPLLIASFLFMLQTPIASAKIIERMVPPDTIVPSTQYSSGSHSQSTANPLDQLNQQDIQIQPMNASGTILTRAQFVTLLVDKIYSKQQMQNCFWDISPTRMPRFTLLFTDVPAQAADAGEICIAMRNGIVRGYKDGSFHPNQPISFVEASKILSRAFVLAPYAETDMNEAWYTPYVYALSERNAIPLSITRLDHLVTPAEAQDMLQRIAYGVTWKQSRTFQQMMDEWMPVWKPSASASSSSSSSQQKQAPMIPARTTPLEGSTSSTMSQAASSSSVASAKPWYQIF